MNIQDMIFEIRGQRVMIDRDFMFRLSDEETIELVTNCDRLQNLKHSSSNPCAFTQEGVSMLSGVLNSDIAIDTNIYIMRGFVAARNAIATLSVGRQIKKLSAEIEFIKSEMEDTLEIQNDINESTRAQLDAISTALAELQSSKSQNATIKKRRPIGFIQPKDEEDEGGEMTD